MNEDSLFRCILDDDRLNDGLLRLWNSRLDEADEMFRVTDPPSDHDESAASLRRALLYADVSFFSAVLSEEGFDEAHSRIDVVEQMVNGTAKTPSGSVLWWFGDSSSTMQRPDIRHVCAAEVSFMRCALHFRESSYVRGGYYFTRAWRSYRSAAIHWRIVRGDVLVDEDKGVELDNGVELDTGAAETDGQKTDRRHAFSSVLLGLGIFYFFVSLIPSSFLWVVEAVGFKADRQLGIRCLGRAVDVAGCRSPLALLLFIWVQMFFLNDLEQARLLLDRALRVFPTGAVFIYLAGYLERKCGRLDKALEQFEKCEAASRQLLSSVQTASVYEQGDCLFLAGRWADAVAKFETFLRIHTAPSFRAFCAFQLAVALFQLDQPDRARHWLEKLISDGWERKHFTYDQFAARKARSYLNGGWTDLEALLIRFRFETEAQRCQDARQTAAAAGRRLCRSVLQNPDATALLAPHKTLEKFLQHLLQGVATGDGGTGDDTGVDPLWPDDRLRADAADASEQTALVASLDDVVVYLYFCGVLLRQMGRPSAAWRHFAQCVALGKGVTDESWVLPHALCEMAEMALSKQRFDQCGQLIERARLQKNYDFDKPLVRRLERCSDALKKKISD